MHVIPSSTQFRDLSPKAQKLNRFYIDRLRELFGSLPATSITRPVVMRLKETESARPWYCNHLLSKLRLVLQHAADTGMLKVNPAARAKIRQPAPRHTIWSQEQTQSLLEAAGPDIRVAAALLLYTAQRPSDVLAMTWGASVRAQWPYVVVPAPTEDR